MIANYGYTDGAGEYFITVDTGKCKNCRDKFCITACPKQVLIEMEDDYGDMVMAIKEIVRRSIKYECSDCKPNKNRLPLPCVAACPFQAIKHSW